jgi:hypothetical protein
MIGVTKTNFYGYRDSFKCSHPDLKSHLKALKN